MRDIVDYIFVDFDVPLILNFRKLTFMIRETTYLYAHFENVTHINVTYDIGLQF